MPKTFPSDRGPQFTSNLWFQLCEMLNISHRQTTVYHPELNGAVKRLHCRLKDALRTRASTATWAEELPFVLLGHAHSQGKTLVFPRLRLSLVPQCVALLPNEFLQGEEISGEKISGEKISVDSIIKNFPTTLDAPVFSLPRHNCSTQLPSKLPAELLSAHLVWVRRGGAVPPLQPLYDSPFTVLRHGLAPSPSESGPGTTRS